MESTQSIWTPVESSGVHLDSGGDCKVLGILGIVGSVAASFAQSKGVGELIAGIGGLEMGIGIGKEIGDSKDLETVGAGGSVCMDIEAEEDGRMIGGVV